MPMWGGWGGPWYAWFFMPIFWLLVIAGVIAVALWRDGGGRKGDSEVSRELAALRRDIQDLRDEMRKLREEGKVVGATGG